jgi:hypothetical protein
MTMDLPTSIRKAVQLIPGSARQLAMEAGIDPSLLTRICTGHKTATPEVAAKLERALRDWAERCGKAADLINRQL